MEPIGYLCEAETLAKLRAILKRLYGDGTHLTPDARRDLANTMSVVLDEFHPYTEPT